jgi:D-alanyl-D-alanine carboxypeptidase
LVATATRNNKRLIAVVLGSPSSPYRAAKAAGLLERGFSRGPLSWLAPSLGNVESLHPINAAPPDLRDEMCGSHRKRPAAEDADDETDTSTGFMISSLPPAPGKPSTLLKDRPDTMKAITVFVGAAKNAAEAQFVAARAKIAKLAKGKKAAPTTQATAPAAPAPATVAAAPPAIAAPATTAAAPASPPPLQTVSSPPPGVFAPQSPLQQRTVRTFPTATDASNPSAMSFAPAAKADPAPLTAMPEATSSAAKPALASTKTAPVKTSSAKTSAPPKSKNADKKTDKKDAKKDGKKPAKSAAAATNASKQ